MKINLIKKRYFVALFILLVFLVHGFIHVNKNRAIEAYLLTKTDQMYLEYRTVYEKNRNIADLVFKTEVNVPQIIKLFKNRERIELHHYLATNYEELRTFSVRQLHFHLPNNDSFLRMHRPSKFGDSLSKARLTVKYVNENLKSIDGFEEGKIFNGFRFVYPLFDGSEHIGSVEISFSALAFIKDITKYYKIKSNFLIDKTVVSQKVFKDEQSNYVQSPLPQFYFQKSVVKYLEIDFSKKLTSKEKSKDIFNNIKVGEPFSTYDRLLNQIITFVPLKNPITKNVVAALSFRSNDMFIAKENKNALILLMISIVIIGVVLLLIYKELKYKMDLESIVKERTKELQELNLKFKDMANTDALTGAYNRRYFYEVAEKILAITKRERQQLSIAMLDIDNFKNVNDTYGHDVGDVVLKALVKRVNSLIRESDVFVRYGGEEFVLLFANTTLKQALIISEKLRKGIESCTVIDGLTFTVSIGVSEFMESDDIASVLKKADLALYEAKNSGKNRVCYKEI